MCKQLALLLAALATQAIYPAFAADDWPAVSTQVIALSDQGQTNEGCRNRALTVMSDLSLNNLGVAGENTT